jgi:septal ring factor EnvC (AmiA/AmiB activator)
LERTNSISSRLQITLQRIQLQQNQVNRISGQLESLRNEIVRSETEQGQTASNLTDLESRIEQEQNPNTQKTLQSEQKYMKALAEQKSRVVQDERAREGELASSLQTEQEKLSELQARLDSLEKLIESSQAR